MREHIGWGRGKAVSMDLAGELVVQRVLKMRLLECQLGQTEMWPFLHDFWFSIL